MPVGTERVTVRVTVTTAVPPAGGMIVLVEKNAWTPGGRLAVFRATSSLKPPIDWSVRVKVAEDAWGMLIGLGSAASRKSDGTEELAVSVATFVTCVVRLIVCVVESVVTVLDVVVPT